MTGAGAVDGVGIDGTDSGQDINYMTRSNFDETFPKTPVKSRLLPKRAAAFNLYTQEQADENAAAMETEEVIFGDDKGLLIEKNGTVTKLGYELGADYNDPKWEEVLNQLTEEETEELFLHGYVKTEKLESIGKTFGKRS